VGTSKVAGGTKEDYATGVSVFGVWIGLPSNLVYMVIWELLPTGDLQAIALNRMWTGWGLLNVGYLTARLRIAPSF
jgi:hypothetical protein